MKNKKIKLYNRYNHNIYLEKQSENNYILSADDLTDLKYMRIGKEDDSEDSNIIYIDPNGGPFINIGYEICKNMIIDKIIYNKFDGSYHLYTTDKEEFLHK